MGRTGYQILGYAVWTGGKWYLRRRYGDTPRRIAMGTLLVVVIGAIVLGGRRVADNG